MTQFEFSPAKDYDGLLRQAVAMAMLIRSMEKQKAFQSIKLEDMARELALHGHEEINAQRETNSILTNEVEALEKQLTVYKNALTLIAMDKAEFDNATAEMERDGMKLIAQIALTP